MIKMAVCRGREKEREKKKSGGMRGRLGEMLGSNWRLCVEEMSVVMSHLLQANRMADQSWHVPRSQWEGQDREKTKCVGRGQ